MRGCAAAEAREACSRQQRSSLWSPVDESLAVGTDLGAEHTRIDPALQHASGVDARLTVDSGIEGVGGADRCREYWLPRCRLGRGIQQIHVWLSARDTVRPFHLPPPTPS